MAAWQAKFYATPPFRNDQGWEAWAPFPLFRRRLSDLFGQEHPMEWSDHGIHWGDYGHHDARLWLDDAEAMLLMRVDVRDADSAFLRNVVGLLSEFGMVLVHDDERIAAREETFLAMLRESKAMRFCQDPRGTIDESETVRRTDRDNSAS